MGSLLILGAGLAIGLAGPAAAQLALPQPAENPLTADLSSDPVILLRRAEAPAELFRATVAGAIARHPTRAESSALYDEAEATLAQARGERLPSADVTLTSFKVISRAFSDDPDNLLERARPDQRTDALLTLNQTLIDFGAGGARVAAAGARLRAAAAEIERASDRVALTAIGAWYEVFGYRALVDLAEGSIASQRRAKDMTAERVRQGVAPEADLVRADGDIASAEIRLARFQRLLATAEAQFAEIVGAPPPADLRRAPAPPQLHASKDAASLSAAERNPSVRSADALAEASREEARSARAEEAGVLGAAIDAGRYGVFETDRDYDVRGRLTYRARLFGGTDQRSHQADARSRAAEARAIVARQEAEREAAIAWADVEALERQLTAMEAAYMASRRSRDVMVERFQAARATMLDVVAAEQGLFESATAYIQALTELDAARYVLLSRTGGLLAQLGVDPAAEAWQ